MLSIEISKREGRTLVIGHYAGHAALDVDDKLMLFAFPKVSKPISLERALGELYQDDDYTNVDFEKTDVVLILDSCYSGQATRGLRDTNRSM